MINIRIFDQHRLANDMDTTGANLVTDLEKFLNRMGTVPGLDASDVATLSAFTFNVTYAETFPTEAEIEDFAVNDFPIYLLTARGMLARSGQQIVDLFIAHKIPLKTHVKRLIPDPDIPPPLVSADIRWVHPFDKLENDWEKEQSILGFGIPGDYFIEGSQNKCRKIGLIKMGGK